MPHSCRILLIRYFTPLSVKKLCCAVSSSVAPPDTYTALAFTTADELYDFMVTHNKLGKGDAESVK